MRHAPTIKYITSLAAALILTVLLWLALWSHPASLLTSSVGLLLFLLLLWLLTAHWRAARNQDGSLRRRETRLRAVFERAPIGISILDAQGRPVDSNPAYQEMLQRGAETALPAGGGTTQPGANGSLLGHRRSGDGGQIEVQGVASDGEIWRGRLTTFSMGGDGHARFEARILEDVTDVRRAEETRCWSELWLALHDLPMAGTSDGAFGEYVVAVLRLLCERTGWDAGLFWTIEREIDALRCHSVWCGPSSGLRAFGADCRDLALGKGEGLPGRAWRDLQPHWLSQSAADGHVRRSIAAERAGLRSAFCFPILGGDAVSGVIELWSQWPADQSEEFVRGMCATADRVCAQLNRSLELGHVVEGSRFHEERYTALTEIVRDAVIMIDEESHMLAVNQAAERLFGYTRQELLGQSLTMLMPENLRRSHLAPMKRFCQTGSRNVRWEGLELKGVCKDGSTVLLEVSLIESRQNGDRVFIGYMQDITDRRLEESALVYQALHDTLTDLPNRRLLEERLGRAISTAHRQQTPVALLFMDLDRFKEVNDSLGHHCGALLLQHVASRLQQTLRESDMVARLGGDEFALLLPTTDEPGACLATGRVTEALKQPFVLEGHRFQIGANIGIALYPRHGDDAPTLMRRADVAMYAAKRGGEDYKVYSAQRDEANSTRLLMTAELRQANERNEIVLYHQPKVSLTDGSAEHVEALVRWQHPQRGFTPPDLFIPLAEETGLVRPLTMWVLDEALRQHLAWRAEGHDIRVSVNFSARTLHDPGLVETVCELLEANGIEPSSLQIEITESALMLDPDRALETLGRLRSAGVWTSIDDFGTGYSSLGYLKELPVDEMKIDKSFVLDMATNRDDASIVRSIVALGHNLGLKVVAEGVDNKRTIDMLRAMGCDLAQGYYLSHPLPAHDLSVWFGGPKSQLAGVS